MVLAAGAQAEQLFFNIESEGFNGDRTIMRGFLNRPALPQSNAKLVPIPGDVDNEIENGYPSTQQLVRKYECAIKAISKAAYMRLKKEDVVGCKFARLTLLNECEVQTIFDENQDS